jgi:hypothetical protein
MFPSQHLHPGSRARAQFAFPALDSNSVIARIETTVEGLISEIAEGRVPALQLGARSASAARLDNEVGDEDARGTQRSILSNQGAAALAYARGKFAFLRRGFDGGPGAAWRGKCAACGLHRASHCPGLLVQRARPQGRFLNG